MSAGELALEQAIEALAEMLERLANTNGRLVDMIVDLQKRVAKLEQGQVRLK